MNERMLLNFAIGVGEIMLRSGAETNRIEDTVERILSVKEGAMPEVFVTPTGFFASIQGELTGVITSFVRVTNRSIDLERLVRANALSRNFVEGNITLTEGFAELERINQSKPFARWLVTASTGLLCFSFTLLFGGHIADAGSAFLVGLLLGLLQLLLSAKNVASFLSNFFGGMLVCAAALGFYFLGFCQNYETVIIGSIMPLVPGFCITTAVRDIMSGDYLSGTSRIAEATLAATAIAAGVGILLSVYFSFGGGRL